MNGCRAHSRLLLEGNPDAAVIQGDLREPAKILADPGTQLMLDFTQPVAVFLSAVLHFIPDSGQPADIIATVRDALAPGSYLVICHACRDEQPSLATSFETVYNSRVTAHLSRQGFGQRIARYSADLIDVFEKDPLLEAAALVGWRGRCAGRTPQSHGCTPSTATACGHARR